MNPLYRKMFQQPGMSRQPMGILASSPELANVAAQRQPVRMAQGGDVGLQKVVSQLEALKQSGDVESLKRVANDPSAPGLVRRIANNFADSLLPDSVPLIQVGDVNLGNALSDAANRKPVGQSVGGQERSAVITPQGNVGDVNLSNALSDFSGRKPIGQSVGGQERSAALRSVPGKVAGVVGAGVDELTRTRGPALKDVYGPFPDSPLNAFLRKFNVGQVGPDAPTAVPDESGLMTVSGDKPTGMLGIPTALSGIATGVEKVVRAGPAARAKGPQPPAPEPVPDMPSEGLIKDRSVGTLEDYLITGSKTGTSEVSSGAPTPKDNAKRPDGSTATDADAMAADAAITPVIEKPTVDLITSKTEDGEAAAASAGVKLGAAGETLAKSQDLGVADFNTLINRMVGIDSAVSEKTGKAPNKKEMVKAEMEILKEFFGEKTSKDIRTTASYNLMMTGLMIAAGESPDAGTNIAKGLAAGLKSYGDATGEAAKEREKLEQALGLQAYKNVTDKMAADALAQTKQKELRMQLGSQFAIANMNNNAAADRLNTQIGAQRDEWKAKLNQSSDQFKQSLDLKVKELNMPPETIRTLIELQKTPALLEIQRQYAANKDPNKTYVDILGKLLSSPATGFLATQPGGSDKLTAVAQALAESAPYTLLDSETTKTTGTGTGTGTGTIPTYETQPSNEELQNLWNQGTRSIKIGGTTYPLEGPAQGNK